MLPLKVLTCGNSAPGSGNKATLERQSHGAAGCELLQFPSNADVPSPLPPDDLGRSN